MMQPSSASANDDFQPMRIGFACNWKKPRIATWSHIASSVSEALSGQRGIACVDIDVSLPQYQLYTYALLSSRIVDGKLKSKFRHSPAYLRRLERNFQKIVNTSGRLDAIIEVGDVGVASGIPCYFYQDFTIDQLIQYYREHGQPRPMFEMFTMDDLLRRRERQQRLYEQCAGVFCMTRTMAESLVQTSGLAASKVHVIHTGIHVRPTEKVVAPFPKNSQPMVLFVGRDFFRKAGDLVVEAFKHIRKEQLPGAQLVIAGPKQWPLRGAIPNGVVFLGDASWDVLEGYYSATDLFCMPSRDEGFGIVYAEALCHGIPCIARKTETISEIIQDGVNGYVIENDDPHSLGELILKALENNEMRERVRESAMSNRAYYSWERVAFDMVSVIRKDKFGQIAV